VTTDALPAAIACRKSPLGMKVIRCRYGRYFGVKWVSMS
jgi:hypothetical protein